MVQSPLTETENVLVEITGTHPFSPDASDKRYVFTGKVYGHGYQINGAEIDPTIEESGSDSSGQPGEDSSAGRTDDPIIVIAGIDKGNSYYPESPHYAFSAWYEGSQLGGDFNSDKNYLVWEIEQPSFPSTIKIAASDSSSGDKDAADKVCDGAADDVEIFEGIKNVAENGYVFLLNGTYYYAKALEFDSSTTKELLSKSWALVGNDMANVTVTPESGKSPDYFLRWYLPYVEDYLAHSIAFSNMTIDGAGTSLNGINLHGRFDEAGHIGHVSLSKITVKNCTRSGVSIWHLPQFVSIQYSYFESNGDDGLYIRGLPLGSVYRSESNNNSGDGFYAQKSGVFYVQNATSGNTQGVRGGISLVSNYWSDGYTLDLYLEPGTITDCTNAAGDVVCKVNNGLLHKLSGPTGTITAEKISSVEKDSDGHITNIYIGFEDIAEVENGIVTDIY